MKIRSQSTASIIKLLRRGMNGALSTSSLSRSGWPYASMITYATDVGGSPIFLLSDLSDHTKNLEKDERAGFLVESCSALKRPQTGKRISLLGRINKTKNDNDAERFLARHPSAKNYVFFKDFNFYKMAVSEVHFIGGFAISEWYKGNDIIALKKHVNDLTMNVDAILDHMNTIPVLKLSQIGNYTYPLLDQHMNGLKVAPFTKFIKNIQRFTRVLLSEIFLESTI